VILVMTGTNCPPFDRLLREIEPLGDEEQFVVQHGPSSIRPKNARCVEYLPYGELVELIREARRVVTHAGVGSILVSIANEQRPIVVPRLAALGENVDDHQVELGRRLAVDGVVDLVEDPGDLRAAVAARQDSAVGSSGHDSKLVEDLRVYVDQRVAATRSASHTAGVEE
jgi:UDP-N-acetylglucosamine--N-acetylmuramyl-(pentapeptide) pyrophosphoryl-undecaprenol N-acetylglucosamine transferase